MSEVAASVVLTIESSSSVAWPNFPACSISGLMAAISALVRAIALAISTKSKRMRSTDSAGRSRATHRRLQAVDGAEQHLGVGVTIASGIFGEKPAAAVGLHDRGFDRLVIG